MSTRLRGILQGMAGDDTRAVVLLGADGRAVDTVVKGSAHDPSAVTEDLIALFKVGAYCARKMDGGDVDYLTVTTESLALLVVAVGPAHYLAAVLDAGGNVARARLAVRRCKAEIMEELG